jgi:hypothetical protein
MIVPPKVKRALRACWLAVVLAAGPLVAQEPPAADPSDPIVVSRAVVPAVGQIGGFKGVIWRSDVALYNDSPAPVTVVVSPLPLPELFQMFELPPGGTSIYTNVVDSFGIGGVAPLLVQTLAQRSVTVYATAYGIFEGNPTPRQLIPVLYDELPPSIQQIRGLAMNEARRSNIGLVNLGEAPATFTLALQRLEERPLATLVVVVGPESSVHVPLNQLFPLVTEGTDLTLLVDSISPRTYAYGSVVRNDTHEAVFVQPFVSVR